MSNDHFFNPPPSIPVGNGGYRPHAGGRPKGTKNKKPAAGEQETPYQRYERARADSEEEKARIARVKADLDEGAVVDRQSVRDASAQAFAACSQALDAIPDALERDGITVDVTLKVGAIINAAKAQLAADLEAMHNDAKSEE